MKPFDTAAFASADPRQLQRAARELGHGLHTRSPGELARIRRELAQRAQVAETDYTRGFREAIEHMLAGASAEAKHRRAIADDVNTARLRKNAVKVLLALHADHDVPSSIAEKTGLKLPAVSAELTELEREGFVERLEPAAGEDQRTSPRVLTGRGSRVTEELMKTEVSPTAEAARELAPVFASFISRLTDEGCVTREHLGRLAAARLGSVSGAFVCDEFLRHAQALYFVSSARSVFTLTNLLYAQQWADSLNAALRSREMPPVFQQLVNLARHATVWLRTTRSIRGPLSVALRQHDIRNVHPWSLDDARSEQLPVPTGDYFMIWGNPEVMSHDLGLEHFRELVARATRRYCYVMDDARLPPNIERLDFDADLIDR